MPASCWYGLFRRSDYSLCEGWEVSPPPFRFIANRSAVQYMRKTSAFDLHCQPSNVGCIDRLNSLSDRPRWDPPGVAVFYHSQSDVTRARCAGERRNLLPHLRFRLATDMSKLTGIGTVPLWPRLSPPSPRWDHGAVATPKRPFVRSCRLFGSCRLIGSCRLSLVPRLGIDAFS